MKEFSAVVLGVLAGTLFSFIITFLYIAGVRHVGPKVFQSWRILLLLPVHCIVAFSLSAPMLLPLSLLRSISGADPFHDAPLFALLMIFAVSGVGFSSTYFFRQWRRLEAE